MLLSTPQRIYPPQPLSAETSSQLKYQPNPKSHPKESNDSLSKI
jgi:hypothetical protein